MMGCKAKIMAALLLFACFFVGSAPSPDMVIPLPSLNNPEQIRINDEFIFIMDDNSIKMFDRNNFRFVRSIGRQGQGPGEFDGLISFQILADRILADDSYKISFFSFTGEMTEDKKTGSLIFDIKRIQDNFVGYVIILNEPDDFYLAYILYDADFRKIKELHRGKWIKHKNRRNDFFEIHFYDTAEDRIVIAHRKGAVIDIMDSKGEILHNIALKTKPLRFTRQDKEKVFQYWKNDLGYSPRQMEMVEKKTGFPKYYPSIMTGALDGGKIYAVTYRKRADRYQCQVYDMEGKFIEEIFIPLKLWAPNSAYPFAVNSGRLYQLVYDDESLSWNLHIHRIH